jgi:outer membrane protein TolC
VDQAESLFHNARASVSTLEIFLQQLKNALAILLGEPPGELSYRFAERRAISIARPEIELSMP